jgi:glucose/arabinose dehydrogenase
LATSNRSVFTGSSFPAAYRNQIIVARHGSWNRTNKAGGDLVLVKLKPDGSFSSMEPFVTGFLENNNYLARPVDVLRGRALWRP